MGFLFIRYVWFWNLFGAFCCTEVMFVLIFKLHAVKRNVLFALKLYFWQCPKDKLDTVLSPLSTEWMYRCVQKSSKLCVLSKITRFQTARFQRNWLFVHIFSRSKLYGLLKYIKVSSVLKIKVVRNGWMEWMKYIFIR